MALAAFTEIASGFQHSGLSVLPLLCHLQSDLSSWFPSPIFCSLAVGMSHGCLAELCRDLEPILHPAVSSALHHGFGGKSSVPFAGTLECCTSGVWSCFVFHWWYHFLLYLPSCFSSLNFTEWQWDKVHRSLIHFRIFALAADLDGICLLVCSFWHSSLETKLAASDSSC